MKPLTNNQLYISYNVLKLIYSNVEFPNFPEVTLPLQGHGKGTGRREGRRDRGMRRRENGYHPLTILVLAL